MIFNRKLEVKMVKVKKVEPQQEAANTDHFEKKVKIISDSIKKMGVNAAACGAGYIILDTLRKVAVAKATQ